MKTRNLFTMFAAAVISIALVGCDQATSSNDTNEVTTGYAIKGKLAGTGFKSAQVCLNGTCVYADPTTGEYAIPSSAATAKATARATAKASARIAGAAVGYAYIIVGSDTLKEIPVLNWNSIIPEKYIVQRNVGVTVPAKYSTGDVQFVYWDNDSIAHAVGVPKVNGLKHSAYVYSYYDSAAFTNHDTLYSWFARVKVHDSVKIGTSISKLTYDAGDIAVDSSDFQIGLFTKGGYYKYVPAGDTMGEYTSTSAEAKYEAAMPDTVLVYSIADTSSMDTNKIHTYYGPMSTRWWQYNSSSNSNDTGTYHGYIIQISFQQFDTSVGSILIRATFNDTIDSSTVSYKDSSLKKLGTSVDLVLDNYNAKHYVQFLASNTTTPLVFKSINIYAIRKRK